MKLAYAMCGSFCTHARALEALRPLAKDNYITPVLSEIVQTTDTRFGSATMGIETRKVAASFDDYGGDLSIDYVVNMEHTVASRNKLNMSVRLRS